uniref:Uncharacterized protein n=1 Tax=Anopheles melas TaxID=34690 RepID=A0A182UJW4_9DIPT
MTASLSAVLAPSSPATSDHLTCGFSTTIAPSSFACSFFFSGSSESESELSFAFDLSSFAAPSPSFTGFFLPFFRSNWTPSLSPAHDYASNSVVRLALRIEQQQYLGPQVIVLLLDTVQHRAEGVEPIVQLENFCGPEKNVWYGC